ncbi:BTAD domain-containing putative transcriptional regulator [Micromonosporaceae bacterium Da 78-11]
MRDGERTLKIGGPREHIVLATLAQRVHYVTSVRQLVDAVWGDSPPSTCRGQIQGCISLLRKLFRDVGLPDAVQTRGSGYLLSLAPDEMDSEEFAHLVSTARQFEAGRQTSEAAETLHRALALWRGPALDGIDSEPVRNAAALLDEARLATVEERLHLDLVLGRHHEVISEIRSLLAEHPLRERLSGYLMLALYRSGRQAEALEAFRRVRATLVTELGIEPGQELRDLEGAVLRRDPALVLRSAVDGSPEVVERVASPRQLPAFTADFVGREHYVEQAARLLSDQGSSGTGRLAVPIIGISGRGGVGKSTLALRMAHEWGTAYPDGHLYVNLDGQDVEARTPALLARFLRALGVNGSLIPDDPEERAEIYRSRLANKRILLLLDGVSDEEQVRLLMPGSPSCAVIVTSRTRLGGLPGAHWLNVDVFDEASSVRFLETIVGRQRLAAEPAATRELVTYCGGLPLALRIAGARLASRPSWRIAELARRLKNEVRRLDELSHHGLQLRSSIALSYRSLSEQAKRLFRLAAIVPTADFPAWAAAALLDTDLVTAEATLERLVDVQVLDMIGCPAGGVRYRFHDLVRVYAHELLTANETPAVRRAALMRLLSGWLSLAEHAHRLEYGGDYTILHGTAERLEVRDWVDDEIVGEPMEWLENERTALVSAVRQAAEAGLDELCWDLALTCVGLFELKGYNDDWRETAELSIEVCTTAGNEIGCAAMLYSLGTLHMVQKRLAEAERDFARAGAIFESAGHVHGHALVLRNAAFVDRLHGDVLPMLSKYHQALVKMRVVGDLIGEANILRSLGKFRIDEGDLDEADAMLTVALALCRKAGYRRGEAQVASRFAELHLRAGRVVLARQTLLEVLSAVRSIGDRVGEAHVLYGLGLVWCEEGRLETAETTLAHALAIAEEIGDRLIEGQAHHALGELAIARADHRTAAVRLASARALFADFGSSIWLAKTMILQSEISAGSSSDPMGRDVSQAIHLLQKIDSKEAALLLDKVEGGRPAVPDGIP